MKVVYLTAGAGGMYCGSCLRDNTLAAALRARGRDITLIPLYTPIRTDEPDASEPRVYYGAINVYLQQRSSLFRRLPAWLDRLLDAPALLRRAARMSGGEIHLEELGRLAVSTLEGEAGRQAKEIKRLLHALVRLRPDVVNLANALFVHLARPIRDTLGIPVLCTLTGEDAFLDKLPEPHRRAADALIRRHQREVDAFIAVSRYYADCCRERFGIDAERLHVVPLGVRVEDPPPPSEPPPEPFTVGYLARICPDKGLHTLCQAMEILHRAGREVRLRVAGHLSAADLGYFEAIRRRMSERLPPRTFEMLGEVDRAGKLALLRSLHVLSVPTVYRDPKGLFVLEAMARGVPVVQPRHGAFPELVDSTGGGLLVEPGDPQALADGLACLMADPGRRRELGRRGQAAVRQRFTDEHMAERTWSIYEQYDRVHHEGHRTGR